MMMQPASHHVLLVVASKQAICQIARSLSSLLASLDLAVPRSESSFTEWRIYVPFGTRNRNLCDACSRVDKFTEGKLVRYEQ
jgi:hypothetical protein